MVESPERYRYSLVEKSVWWAEIGGIVAAVIGIAGSIPDLVFGGAGVAAVSYLAGNEIYSRRSARRVRRK